MVWSIHLIFLASCCLLHRADTFSISNTRLVRSHHGLLQRSLSNTDDDDSKSLVHLEVVATSGLSADERTLVLPEIVSSVNEEFGMEVIIRGERDIVDIDSNLVSASTPGATGRVILISLNNVAKDWDDNDERLEPFKSLISQQIDSLVGFQIEQPILVSVLPNFESDDQQENEIGDILRQIVENEISMYDLRTPIGPDSSTEREREQIFPNTLIEIDGAQIQGTWDTSSILVFDDFVDDSLRERLLDVVNNRGKGYNWDDKNHGPDTSRWRRGGLVDTFGDSDNVPTCWGLTEDATNDLCFNHHDAIMEVEQKISDYFHECIVTRLPEAVLGSCVSPLTANAPTHGDSFSYHIDADPNQTPPSPWTDVYGRYFNRGKGKPRFLSCLIYLNDEWNEEFGAPTEFFDPPTNETYQVYPRPGRVVMMDQDITHKVVPPNEFAGTLPRYSLVWKLIIHPTKAMQNMKLPIDDATTELIQVGSAKT